MAEKTTKVQIRMTPEDLQSLKKLARLERTTMTGWVTIRIKQAAKALKHIRG